MRTWDRPAEGTRATARTPAAPMRLPFEAPGMPLQAAMRSGSAAPPMSMLDRTVQHLQLRAKDPLAATGLSPSGRSVPLLGEKAGVPATEAAEPVAAEGAQPEVARAPAEASLPTFGGKPASLQMACAADCGCTRCGTDKKGSTLQTLGVQREPKPGAGPPLVDGGEVRSRLGVGAPLPAPIAQKLSNAYGHDLSSVRVHDGHAMADQLGARAFTVGRDVAFAPGEYKPGTPEGDRLISHELAHVVQQAGGQGTIQGAGLSEDGYEREADTAAAQVSSGQPVAPLTSVSGSRVQRAGADAGTDTPPKDAGAPVAGVPLPDPPVCDPAARSLLDSEVVELQGTSTFEPSDELGEFLYCMAPDPFPVKVRFGELASGTIQVRAVGPRDFQTTGALPHIDLTHPAFPKGSASLAVFVNGSMVTGRILWGLVATTTTVITTNSTTIGIGPIEITATDTTVSSSTRVDDLTPSENELGWKGLNDLQMFTITNELSGGWLEYNAVFDFLLDMGFKGQGSFSVLDADQSFEATAQIEADGVPEQEMKLERGPDNTIFGSVDLSYQMDPLDVLGGELSGSLSGSFANGKMNITGTASYQSDKLNGTVTIMLADEATAWANTLLQMPTSAAATSNPGALDATKHVVVGWGTLDFAFSEWLTGTASVVLDPQGFITSHGAIRPAKAFSFLTDDKLSGRKQLGPTVEASGFVPVWGPTGVTGALKGSLFAAGRVGPGTIHDMELSGVFSTRPDVPISVTLSGVVDLSAIARLELDISGSLSYTLLGKHVKTVSIEVNVLGTSTLKVYARLEPSFTVTRKPDGDFDFNMHGVLKAAAGVNLGLSGSIKPSLFGFGPKFSTGKYQWHVGGLGVKSTLDYKIGDKTSVDLEFEDYQYQATEFHTQAEQLLNNAAEKDKQKGKEHVEEVRGESAPDKPAVPLPAPQKFDLEMNGVKHLLWLDLNPQPLIKMASSEGPLSGKLGGESAVLKEQEKTATGTEQNLVHAEQSAVKGLLAQTAAVESSARAMEAADKPTPDVAGVQELAAAVGRYGDQFQKTDLAHSGTTPDADDPGAAAEQKFVEFELKVIARIQKFVEECDQKVNDAWDKKQPIGKKHTDCWAHTDEVDRDGKPVTVQQTLGQEKEQCVYREMRASPGIPQEGKGKFIGHNITTQKRFNPDGTPFIKGSWKGTIVPDVVLGGPDKSVGAVYDLKFPCPSEHHKAGQWGKGQFEKYQTAFNVDPTLIYPRHK